MKVRTAILLGLMLAAADAASQNRGWLQTIDSMWVRWYRRPNRDTTFVVRPATNWTLKTRANLSWTTIGTEGDYAGHIFQSAFRSDIRAKASLSVGYRGLTLSASVNPTMFTQNPTDVELGLRAYGRRLGAEVMLSEVNTLAGWARHDRDSVPMPEGEVTVRRLATSAYYVFDPRRFSYPAAISQSYVQRRSGGSALAAVALYGLQLENGDAFPSKLDSWCFSVGGGYGYNLVVRRWMFHLSALPTFIVVSRRDYRIDNKVYRIDGSFPEVIITARGAVNYTFGRCFAGITAQLYYMHTGSESHLQLNNLDWQVSAYWGLRL